MSVLSYSGVCSVTPCRTHCYIPVTSSVALCSSDVNPDFGICLPSRYQGNLWLLDNCQESYSEALTYESPSCELKTCTTSCEPSNVCVPCNSPSLSNIRSSCETTNIKSSPSCCPCPQTKGYVSNCYTPTRYASKIYHNYCNDSNCFAQLNCLSKSHRPISYCRLGSFGYRSFKNLGFSPSCYIARNCQPQSYLTRNCQYLSSSPISFRSLSYLPRNYRSLSCIPSTFPPLRYLCSSTRSWSCY
ncbi:PREDICTED: keratin-associated protein 24-1-like [Chrysochloris asiatica]|uniref:Keratin-associated protein n=1 Tax=Chrysochloris asiatica TaxID=185453 RepID=A0A9B0TLI4_CHRAS|nr:PREDICTED: keratin-associated protein 24-1-like [Chrysochloris asiatica]